MDLVAAIGRAPNAVKLINHPQRGCHTRRQQFGQNLKPQREIYE
jgi:hypothetical protein